MNSERVDSSTCAALARRDLIERVAVLLRRNPNEALDPRIPPGRCVLCNVMLPRSYHVSDAREVAVRAWDVAPGSAEEAEALRLKAEFPGDVWVWPVRLCYCAETSAIFEAARELNKERQRRLFERKMENEEAAEPLPFKAGSRSRF